MKELLLDLARGAGEIALAHRRRLGELVVDFKAEKDLVTAADREIEEFLRAEIQRRHPDHGILGEEQAERRTRSEYRWVIDPIDGTGSFVHGQPFYSISIALEKAGEIVAGVVHAPTLGETFCAEKGAGARLGGAGVRVSSRARLKESMLATGFACLRNNQPRNNLPYLAALLPRLRDMRRYGSAALDLCFVACGRLEGFWELNLNYFDVAAGLHILAEAGGTHSDFRGARAGLYGELVASNGLVQREILAVLASVPA